MIKSSPGTMLSMWYIISHLTPVCLWCVYCCYQLKEEAMVLLQGHMANSRWNCDLKLDPCDDGISQALNRYLTTTMSYFPSFHSSPHFQNTFPLHSCLWLLRECTQQITPHIYPAFMKGVLSASHSAQSSLRRWTLLLPLRDLHSKRWRVLRSEIMGCFCFVRSHVTPGQCPLLAAERVTVNRSLDWGLWADTSERSGPRKELRASEDLHAARLEPLTAQIPNLGFLILQVETLKGNGTSLKWNHVWGNLKKIIVSLLIVMPLGSPFNPK